MNKENALFEKGDKKISIALMASFVILTIQYFILAYFNLFGTVNASKIQLLSKLIVGVIFLYALPIVWKRSKKKFIIIYFIGIFLFLINYLMFQQNQAYLKELIIPVFLMSLPIFVFSLSIYNLDILRKVMRSEEHTSELQSRPHLVCRLLLEKK